MNNNGENNTTHTAHAKSGKNHGKSKKNHERNLVSPKEKGGEYVVSSNKDHNRLVSKDKQTIGANEKSITINSNGNHKETKQ